MLDMRVSTYLTATRFARSPLGCTRFLPGARFVDQLAQLLRELAMAAARFIRGRLHRNRVELLVVAFKMALQKGDKMGGRGHGYIGIPAVPTDFMTNFRAVVLRQSPESSGKPIAPKS